MTVLQQRVIVQKLNHERREQLLPPCPRQKAQSNNFCQQRLLAKSQTTDAPKILPEMLQVMKAQVQVQVQVLETICQVQPKYPL